MAGRARQSLNRKKIICGQCKLQVLDEEDAIQCDACEKTLHSVCTKLDKREYEKLIKNESLQYNCHFCDSGCETSVSNDLLEIKTKLKQLDQLDEITKTIQFMSSQYDSILKGVATNKKKIDCLQKENHLLREEVISLKSSIKFLNDGRVKNDCIINGVVLNEVNKDEEAIDVVIGIANKIGANVVADQIDDAYFLHGNNNKSNNREKSNNKKSIVVKFSKKVYKDKFMAEKPKLKEDSSLKSVYINDFLSRESMELLNHAKSVKAVGYKFVFVKSGKIFVKKDEKSRAIVVRSMEDVDKILLRSSKGGVSTSRRGRSIIVDDDDEDDGSVMSEEEEHNTFLSPN